ncbi:MAG TPA: Ig-like domain-containing protein [Anaeromyxobacter sp.]|nr:Ig-like domain-containing protein [Anaeromyxobacter sp.]
MIWTTRRTAAVAALLALAACKDKASPPPPPLVVDAARSTLAAAPASAVADGVAAVTLTATARDAAGTPVPGRAATFAVQGAACTLSPATAATAGDGTATVRLACTASGTKDVSVAIDGVAVAAHAEATFVAGPAAALAFSVQPANAVAGDLLSPSVEVSVHDAFGNVVSSPREISVALAGGPGGAALIGTLTATATGSAAFSDLQVRKAGAGYVLTASSAGLTGATSAPFAISPAEPDAAVSDVAADPTSVAVGGTARLSATVRDAFGNAVPDATVAFAATGAGNAVSAPAATAADGVASGTLSSTKAEAKTVTATVGALALADAPVVAFMAGAPDAWESSLVASPASVPDDGTKAALTVTVRDAYRNPVTGETVTFSSSGRTDLTQPSAPTGADGTAAGSAGALEAGVQRLSARIGDLVVAETDVTFTVAPPSPDRSTVAVAPASLPADGTSTALATITVRDGIGRPVADATVALSFSGPARFQPASARTDASGAATFALTSSSVGKGALTATVNPGAGQVVLAQSPEVEFVTPVYAIGGVVSGLTADGLVLSTPGLPDLAVPSGATQFAFGVEVPSGTAYAVTVAAQPAGLRCAVLNGSGTVADRDVIGVLVDCGATWKQVAAGGHHVVAVKNDGSLYAWGAYADGWMMSNQPRPTSITGPARLGTGFTQVSAGLMHALALKADGSVYAWGKNWAGQLGDGSVSDRTEPVLVGTGFASVSAGNYHSAGVKADGTLWTWGSNWDGQLGDGTTAAHHFPLQVGADRNWASVSAARYHNVARKTDGSVHTWGQNYGGQIGDGTSGTARTRPVLVGTGFAVATAGGDVSAALTPNGDLYMWGYNGYYQLGDGTYDNKLRPTLVGAGWASVEIGGVHTVGVKVDGSLYAWGFNGDGQLGNGERWHRPSPVYVGSGFASASAGGDMSAPGHTAAIKTDGSLYTWGDSTYGQRGDGSATLRDVPVLVAEGFTSIAAGESHTLALEANGSLWAWGDNTYGQIGDGTTGQRSGPVLVGTDFASIAAGANHSLGLKTDDSLWAWGFNLGRIGDGSQYNAHVPRLVGQGFASMDASPDHSVAVKKDGSLWAWGVNSSGQVGDGTTITRNLAVQVGTGFRAASAGGCHTLAVKTDGSLWAWGCNSQTQLGDGTTTTRYLPVQVGTGFASVAAGGQHSLALAPDGALWSWGDNSWGQLGDGTGNGTDRTVPTRVGSEVFAAISAGEEHGVALKSDGRLYAWGQNFSAQVGGGLAGVVPRPALLGAGFTAMSAGWNDGLAVRADGSLWAWGLDEDGQLGDGVREEAVPQLVPDVARAFGLRYGVNPATYTVGAPIAPNVPSSTGGPIASYSVSPPLPPGLRLDAATGVVSGTPTAASPTASHAVTATGPTGTTVTALLTVTVN